MKMYIFSFLFLSCFISLAASAGDDLNSNELCGEAAGGKSPCFYLKELNFHLDGNLYGKESYKIFSQYLNDRVVELDKTLSGSGIKVKFKPFSGSGWVHRPKEKGSNIEITFLLEETTDKKFITITFYTFSKGPFYIKTSQCPSNESACVVEEMRKFIDLIVVKSIIKNEN